MFLSIIHSRSSENCIKVKYKYDKRLNMLNFFLNKNIFYANTGYSSVNNWTTYKSAYLWLYLINIEIKTIQKVR